MIIGLSLKSRQMWKDKIAHFYSFFYVENGKWLNLFCEKQMVISEVL